MLMAVVLLVLMVQIFQTIGTKWSLRSDKRLRK
jgi:D-methionine transport system permease protein